MTFNDDEQINLPQVSEDLPGAYVTGGVQVRVYNNEQAPLEKTKLEVLVEVTGVGDNEERSPVDLVTVLDVSGSMDGDKLKKLKLAMQFLIKKLSSVDRLSVVTFSGSSTRMFPLRQLTDDAKADIEKQVVALKAGGSTNISDGLITGLKVINERHLKEGRIGAIMLMSDGDQTHGDATKVPIGNVAVHTFGFGVDYKPSVLQAVANNSNGGTFSDVQNENNLSGAFSQCLGGLLTVVVQELNLFLSTQTKDTNPQTNPKPEKEAEIEKVHAGNYQKKVEKNSATVFFGELYNREVRLVMVDLILPAVEIGKSTDVLGVFYKYRTSKGNPLFDSPPVTATVTRTGSPSKKENDNVNIEKHRLETVETVKKARGLADNKKLEEAKDELDVAENKLGDVVVEDPKKIIENLIYDLQQLFKLMRTQEIYEKHGRPYALSFESSHERQRYAARGDDLEKQRAFATPRMDAYLEQAKKFDKDPTKPPPSEKDDVKRERADDPLGPILGPLSFYIQTAIQALQSIDNVIKKTIKKTARRT